MAGPANKGGRPRGAKNYKNEVLINIIAGILPNGQYGWDQVAAVYMTAANKDILHDTDDLKRHWVKTLCNGMKKPTGGTGEKGERIHKCIYIERLILDKTHSGILGLSPDGDVESKDGGSGSDMSLNNNSAKVVSSPPPPVQDTTGENKEDEDSELAGIGSSITDQQAEQTTSRPPSRTTAARPASRNSTSSSKNQKTQNSSNKNKDRTSIAGSIAKLINLISTNADKGEEANVAKRMNILMMWQLDSMDMRMERREKEDRKEQDKQKKRQKKKRRKKRAKKAARQAVLEGQADHGGNGKVGPGTADDYSSISSSSSSSSSGDDSTL
jgi:hypothetical protein